MSETLRKRGRQSDSVSSHLEETEPSLHLLQLYKSLSDVDDEECSPNEELVNRAMRSLEEEIATRSSASSRPFNSGDNSTFDDISNGFEGQTRDSGSEQKLYYLLEASDNVLGIPPMPTMNLKYGLSESADLEFRRENCYLEDDFENYQQFAVFEDVWDAKQQQDYLN